MSSSQTANFGLNQWEADDQVLREDFNRDNSILDAQLNRLSFVVGSYTGTQGVTQTFQLGFPIEFLVVFAKNANLYGPNGIHTAAVTSQHKTSGDVTLGVSSFTVSGYSNLNAVDVNPYRYIAWRQI